MFGWALTPVRWMVLQVTSGMVISTFLSAPIMYVSSWLLTIPLMDPTPLVTELENVSFNISIVSLLALVGGSESSGNIWLNCRELLRGA